MAQITISEEHYQELLALAHTRGITPDMLADTLIEEQLLAADQRSFWGNEMDIRIEQSLQELERHPRQAKTDEEFLTDLQARMKSDDDAHP